MASAFVLAWVLERPGDRTATPRPGRALVEPLPGRQPSIAMNPMPPARKVPLRGQLFPIAILRTPPVPKERLLGPP